MILASAGCAQSLATPTASGSAAPAGAPPPSETPTLEVTGASPVAVEMRPSDAGASTGQAGVPPALASQPSAEPPAAPLEPSLAAVVNGVALTRESYERQLAQAQRFLLQRPDLSPDSEEGKAALQELERQVLGWMIDQILIQQAAAAEGIAIGPERIDEELARMRDGDPQRFGEWLAANGMTEEMLREQLHMDLLTAAMRDRVTSAQPRATRHIHACHILVSEASLAATLRQRLLAGESFVALARQYSEDGSTRDSGGDLGFLPEGIMPPEFDQVAFALQAGDISEIIQTDVGFQIIQLVEIDPERPVSEEYWPMVQQHAFEDWMAQQRASASIQRGMP
jgi:hypothetical protein